MGKLIFYENSLRYGLKLLKKEGEKNDKTWRY